MPSPPAYFAHSSPRGKPSDRSHWETTARHTGEVVKRAVEFAEPLNATEEARFTAELHDLGKLTSIFSERLAGRASGLDHWTAGAAVALRLAGDNGRAAALAIQGHHLGLRSATRDSLELLQKDMPPEGRRTLTSTELRTLVNRLKDDGFNPQPPKASILDSSGKPASQLLDVRMLFSCLVDADFLATEAWFQDRERTRGPSLDPDRAVTILEERLATLARTTTASAPMSRMRQDLLDACRKAAQRPIGAYTLSAPTGAGKTLAMLAFALRHASRHNLRRVVIVVPFLSIVEQTARTYREIFEPHFGPHYVLEHHSIAGVEESKEASSDLDPAELQRRLLTENWDAPLVVTTSVQLLESLHAHRPRRCRKLHRLAKSVVLLDEVQTLPLNLVLATLGTLGHLADKFNTTVVFATATQPAFDQLDQAVRQHWSGAGWKPPELVDAEPSLFSRQQRIKIRWQLDKPRTWGDVANEAAEEKQALLIVNLKRHALELFRLLRSRCREEEVLHLSTSMCPAHRLATLDTVRARLREGLPCYLVSTQCVEAGVDIDFPVVYRALAPLDAMAQAAGRANREGRLECGELRVFIPERLTAEEKLYPGATYERAAQVARQLLEEGPLPDHLENPGLFTEYYTRLYSWHLLGREPKEEKGLYRAHLCRDFEKVASEYRLISASTVNVLVPYDKRRYGELLAQAQERLDADWMRQAQRHSVGVYRGSRQLDDLRPVLVPLPTEGPERESDDWFALSELGEYHPATGLQGAPDLFMA